MYRKPGSTMTAVEIVSSMYDGPIPADVMMQARAEDAAYRADPHAVALNAALHGIAWNTTCARESIARIRNLTASGQTVSIESERKQVLTAHLKARRQYQRDLANLIHKAA